MKQTKIHEKILYSFWFLPVLYIIGGILLAIVTVNIDLLFSGKQLKVIGPNMLVPDTERTVKILSALITATLTMTTITFSTIMVVLTTFSKQFSSRTLQNFISDRKTQSVLAIFISGFVYDLIALWLLKAPDGKLLFFTPFFSVLIATLAAVAFVYFINHVAKWVQVNHLIHRLTREARKTADYLNETLLQYERQVEENTSFRENNIKDTIIAEQPGYIDIIHYGELMKLVKQDQIKAKMNVYLGEYVVEGTELLTYYQKETQSTVQTEKYLKCIRVSWERSGLQDVEFSLQKLTDIAIKAISPAINDPNTAINCINRISETLVYLGNKKFQQPGAEHNKDGQALVIKQHRFSHYLYKAFFQICHSAKEDVSVIVAILNGCKLIAIETPSNLQFSIYHFANYVDGVFNKEVLQAQDENFYYHELNQIMKITGYENN